MDAGAGTDGHLRQAACRGQKNENGTRLDHGLVDLALSGGGIRSATFCLGVLQRLAKDGILKHVDYLSTVSGGGYIGGSLAWLLSKWPDKFDTAVQFPFRATTGSILAHLRGHGNYLTPGQGIVSTNVAAPRDGLPLRPPEDAGAVPVNSRATVAA